MHIVFPDGAACLQSREDLLPLKQLGTVEFHETLPRDKTELIRRLRDADAVILDYSVVDVEVLQRCPNLKFICFLGIGYAKYIDVAAATKQGVTVAYTPGYGAVGVAEFTLGLILSLTRHIVSAHESMQRGVWEPARFQGMELQGKTLGIVGLGPIGVEMSRLAAGMGMRTLGWTRNAAPERATHGLTLVSLDELFTVSDIVTLHLSHTAQTERLISRALLDKLKPGALFVNTSRARIVDNQALAELLQRQRIAGAALDVHEEEPTPPAYLFASLPNVLLTPHIGFNSKEAARKMLQIACATLDAFVRGERLHVVNPV